MIREGSCKTALSPSGLPEFRYTLNPYRNCTHACAYCYAPAIVHMSRSDWGSWVEVKRNIPSILAKELRSKPRGKVGISLVTDPYQKAEERYKVTRYCLEQLLRYDWPVTVLTKSNLAARDLPLLSGFTDAELGVTITTPDESVARALEPGASSVAERLGLLMEAVDSGVNTYAFLGPVLPSGLRELLTLVAGTGVKRVLMDSLHLRPGIRFALHEALSDFPSELASIEEAHSDGYGMVFREARDRCRELGLSLEL